MSKDWLSQRQAGEMLCVERSALGAADLRTAVRTRPKGRRLEWYRPELEEVMRIRREIPTSLAGAARTFKALREGRLNGGVT